MYQDNGAIDLFHYIINKLKRQYLFEYSHFFYILPRFLKKAWQKLLYCYAQYHRQSVDFKLLIFPLNITLATFDLFTQILRRRLRAGATCHIGRVRVTLFQRLLAPPERNLNIFLKPRLGGTILSSLGESAEIWDGWGVFLTTPPAFSVKTPPPLTQWRLYQNI